MTPYDERLTPSPATWLLVPVGAALAGASGVPLGAWVAVGAALAVAAVVVGLLTWRTPVLRVDSEGFRAGPALLDPASIGETQALGRELTHEAMGPGLRADAYVLHRSWVRTAVRVEVDDHADPTPYWLVSTRKPEELARALATCRAEHHGGPGQAAHSEQTG